MSSAASDGCDAGTANRVARTPGILRSPSPHLRAGRAAPRPSSAIGRGPRSECPRPAEAVGERDPARVRREGEAGAVAERANRLPDLLEYARVQPEEQVAPVAVPRAHERDVGGRLLCA